MEEGRTTWVNRSAKTTGGAEEAGRSGPERHMVVGTPGGGRLAVSREQWQRTAGGELDGILGTEAYQDMETPIK